MLLPVTSFLLPLEAKTANLNRFGFPFFVQSLYELYTAHDLGTHHHV